MCVFVCRGSSCLIKMMGPRSQAAFNEFSLRVHRRTTFTCAQTHTGAGNPRSELVNKHAALPGSLSQSPTVTSTAACRCAIPSSVSLVQTPEERGAEFSFGCSNSRWTVGRSGTSLLPRLWINTGVASCPLPLPVHGPSPK